MFVVVCYDISHDKRRQILHRRLKNFGRPIQYSVFECLLSEQAFVQLQKTVLRIVNPKEDLVRIYKLCRSCEPSIISINGDISHEELVTLV
jgi:CRISPR-associated protein Cas2